MDWKGIAEFLFGGLLGFLIFWFLLRPLVRRALRSAVQRAWMRNRPAKGERPQVQLIYQDVTYDLTDSLVRLEDDEHGWAVWLVVGPPHLRMEAFGALRLTLTNMPLETRLHTHLAGTSEIKRFLTPEEVDEMFPVRYDSGPHAVEP